MKIKLKRSIPLVLAVVLLSGCGSRSGASLVASPAELAKCYVATATTDELFEAGRMGAQVTRACWQMGPVAALATYAFQSEADEIETSLAYVGLVEGNETYRRGIYAATLPATAPLISRTRVGELGLLLEDVGRTRAMAITCEVAPPEASEVVGALDSLFAMAATAMWVQPGAADASREVATYVLKQAQVELARSTPAKTCDDTLSERFQSQVDQWVAFGKGQHPWAPGCTVALDNNDLLLKCPEAAPAQ